MSDGNRYVSRLSIEETAIKGCNREGKEGDRNDGKKREGKELSGRVIEASLICGTPQLRSALLCNQTIRCWYYRSPQIAP